MAQVKNLRRAVLGSGVGATAGAPSRGESGFRALNYYEPIPLRMAPSEALEAWLVWADHLAKGLPPEGLSASMFAHWTYNTNECAFAQTNMARGLGAPISGWFQNPLRRGSQALGRAAFWGLAFSGDPDRAMEYAYSDASIDHADDGVSCAVAVATMASLAGHGANAADYVKAAKAALPPGSTGQTALTRLLQAFNAGNDLETMHGLLPPALQTRDPQYAPLNLAFIVAGLLYGGGDPGKSLKATAGCGGAADQNALVVGLITAADADLDPEWLDPLDEAFVCGHGLRSIEPPRTIEDLADRIASIVRLPPAAPLETAPALESDVEVTATEPIEEATTAVQVKSMPAVVLASDLGRRLTEVPDEAVARVGDLVLSYKYVDAPVAVPGKSNRLVLTVGNPGASEVVVEPVLQSPAGWLTASKLTSFRLRQGERSQFALVVQAPQNSIIAPVTNLHLTLNKHEVLVPILAGQPWYWVGPFVNHDGMGFDKPYRAEDVQTVGETFNGRSDLPVKWTREVFPGVEFDLEAKFASGPGIVYLHAKAMFAEPGRYRIVAATAVGARVWVDKKEVVKYHDTHTPIPRAIQPYVGEFEVDRYAEILVKVMRNHDPLPPLILYFLAEDGRHIEPIAFEAMPS